MIVTMTELHFLWPLSGGLLIGLSAALYLLLAGRVAGISGLAANVLGLANGGGWTPVRTQAAGFVVGILLGAAGGNYHALSGQRPAAAQSSAYSGKYLRYFGQAAHPRCPRCKVPLDRLHDGSAAPPEA